MIQIDFVLVPVVVCPKCEQASTENFQSCIDPINDYYVCDYCGSKVHVASIVSEVVKVRAEC